MKLADFLNLRTISGQITALVITSIAAIHLILTIIFLISRPEQPDPSIDRGHAQFGAAVQLLGARRLGPGGLEVALLVRHAGLEHQPQILIRAGRVSYVKLHGLTRLDVIGDGGHGNDERH